MLILKHPGCGYACNRFMKIVFENENFIAVDKEPSVLTVPSRLGAADSRPCLGIELQNKIGGQIFPVHRLDFEVSGLVLFAKSAAAHKSANLFFESREVQKTYHAVTSFEKSAPPKNGETFEWNQKLVRGKKRTFIADHGQESITSAKVLECSDSSILWQLEPKTGRSHQLRVALSSHGYPIHGDALYGSKASYGVNSIALRSIRLNFTHAHEAIKFGLPQIIEVDGLSI